MGSCPPCQTPCHLAVQGTSSFPQPSKKHRYHRLHLPSAVSVTMTTRTVMPMQTCPLSVMDR